VFIVWILNCCDFNCLLPVRSVTWRDCSPKWPVKFWVRR